MDKKKKWLKITLGIMALVIVGVYIGGIAAFHGKFLKNTDINGMDVSDMTVEEAEKLIDEIPSIETLSIENEKFREDSYKKCIRTCECRDLLRIIKTIYIRKQARLSHGKKTTATDERYLKLAEDHLYSEFSMLLDIPKEHMAGYIEQRVHQHREEEQACAV